MGMVILSTDFHRFMECVGFSALWYLSHCGIVPLWGLIRLLSGFPPQILYSHCGVKPSGLCVNFSNHSPISCPIASWHCRDTKTLPTDFHRSMGRGSISHIASCGVWGMSVCRHCVSFAYIIIIQDGGGKSNEKICFNIF